MPQALIQSSYAQALSRLIAFCKDVGSAEDCLHDAIEQALIKWPQGQPDNPVAWLVTTARNKFIDQYRRAAKHTNYDTIAPTLDEPDLSEQALLQSYNDDLLRLIFTCSHPALNLPTQVALTLKHVLGLSVEQIANALVIPSKTMEQRLLRAKKKIAAANITYDIPPPSQWHSRLTGVLKTIYLLFNEGYLTSTGQLPQAPDLCKEAIRLCRLLHSVVKNEPEVIGLLALMLHQNARANARYGPDGEVILQKHQNRQLYDLQQIKQADVLVEKALKLGRGSPYAIQAAIASLYNHAPTEQDTDWQQIEGLYKVLLKLDPNPVIKLNAAVVSAKTKGLAFAIHEVLLLKQQLKEYRHFYTCLGGLYFEQSDYKKAYREYLKATEMTHSKAELDFLKERMDQCLTFIQNSAG